jgi:hypothetical protein
MQDVRLPADGESRKLVVILVDPEFRQQPYRMKAVR